MHTHLWTILEPARPHPPAVGVEKQGTPVRALSTRAGWPRPYGQPACRGAVIAPRDPRRRVGARSSRPGDV